MHPNAAFRGVEADRALCDARERGFGVLTVNGPDGILASHLPVIIGTADIHAHLVRSNPIARLLGKAGPQDALLVVSGPDGYISPDWYGEDDLVPTWNYVAVHLRGTVTALPDEALRPHLDHLSEQYEAHLAPKRPWTMDKMDPEVIAKLMRMLVPVHMTIDKIESTYKLNQNRTPDARHRAAAEVVRSPLGHDQQALARMMTDQPDT